MRGVTSVTLLVTVVSLVDNAGHHNSSSVRNSAWVLFFSSGNSDSSLLPEFCVYQWRGV